MALVQIIEELVAWTFSLIQTYGSFSVFIAVILEEILLPIPAPLVIMGASVLLIDPVLPLWDAIIRMFLAIVIPAALASTIGSFFTYGIGYYGGRPFINRFQKFLGVSWLEIEKTEKKLEKGKKTWTTIAVLRAIPFFPIAFVSLTSGVLRLSWKKYAVATFIGSIPRNFILAFVGWEMGYAYTNLASKLDVMENIIAIVVVLVIVYVLYRYRHKYTNRVNQYRKVITENNRKITELAKQRLRKRN